MNYVKLSALALACFLSPVYASSPAPANSIQVSEAYSRITAPTVKMGGAFMKISNNSQEDDTLIAAESTVAKSIELHTTVIDDQGVMKMREMKDGIPLPAGKTVELQPGGLHVMLMGIKNPLKLNDTFPLTLIFKKAPKQTITVDVNNGKVTDVSNMKMEHHHEHEHNHEHQHQHQ